jgi:hypothetical protein
MIKQDTMLEPTKKTEYKYMRMMFQKGRMVSHSGSTSFLLFVFRRLNCRSIPILGNGLGLARFNFESYASKQKKIPNSSLSQA